jgi:GDP-mannose 6-dehydrogenase
VNDAWGHGDDQMQISIFGLGYVGCVSAACLARDGHTVAALDVNPDKLAVLAAGLSPIQEPGLAPLIATAVADGRLQATADVVRAVSESDLSFVCVGTPSAAGGAPDLQYVQRVCAQIGAALRHAHQSHTVVLRSTMLPGSTEDVMVPILNRASGQQAGRDFGVCYNPEFLREGVAISDFCRPPRVVIGQLDTRSGDALEPIYRSLHAPIVRTAIRTAEMVKYTDNAFHALKVAFANEIGTLCAALTIDSHDVMELFTLDTTLNLGAAYLRPGYAFGGSCLPKDLRALLQRARELKVPGPLLAAVLASNEQHQRRAIELIRRTGRKKIGVLGLSYKDGTDDLRESPAVELIEQLLRDGYDVSVYDPNVSPSALVGANRSYVERELPHLSALLCATLTALLEHAEVLVISTTRDEFAAVLERLRPDQVVIDLVRIRRDCSGLGSRYTGLCW